MNITDESQFIDIDTINQGVLKIYDAANNCTECIKSLKKAEESLNEKCLSIDGRTVIPSIETLIECIEKTKEYIRKFGDSVLSSANEVLSMQKASLAAYRASLKKEKEEDK